MFISNHIYNSFRLIHSHSPFNGPNTQCFFSQYQNALYVLNADTTQASNMHIYSFETQSWTTQTISASGTDPSTLTAILDRNTNVFFALSNSQLYSLDMGTLSASDGATRSWTYVQDPPFAQNGAYPKPVMGLAQNHIHFLNSGNAAQVDIFVIHFSYTQPEAQVFAPLEPGGSGFPSTTGKTASIFKGLENPQQYFAFIPDDGSATYIFDTIVSVCISLCSRKILTMIKGKRYPSNARTSRQINLTSCGRSTGDCTNDNFWRCLVDSLQPR